MTLTRRSLFIMLLILMVALTTACGGTQEPAPPEEPAPAETQPSAEEATETSETDGDYPELTNTEMILSTTTSTENSGLLDFILPDFESTYEIDVKVVAVGSGAALQMGADGEADVLLAHAKAREEELVADGHGLERFDVMYNDFIIVGPPDDPAGLMDAAAGDVLAGLTLISEKEGTFVSRGDDSGTHIMEVNLWKEIGLEEPDASWYISAGQGMGDVIQMANELEGYTLTDRATYLSMLGSIDLVIAVEGDPKLFNQYGVIAVNPDKGDHINYAAAARFVDWILSSETQELISQFGVEEFGAPLFFPNAQ
ncbi:MULTISPECIES: substrate-binding domain-containing protein [Anoxynatronum]|uniref:Tungstate transport system substrate-binding protein n=2 Tax=Anoxynatronum TaxID=210622 RepID=A0AA46AHI6_9CLOT|nr:substrate-binding domain-containing protein [Anoxynatronum buryatiense]SMP39908.1 tungstate transport system substrate-binding protein [Anoxynatronum buryatiense]